MRFWLAVATAGATIDGRTLSADDFNDMAESYNPDLYAATINYEHYRYFGNFGSVWGLKVQDDEIDGNTETRLYAEIEPNKQMMQLNAEGQKLFTSIEFVPNFRSTGKPYFFGLALTDTPASVGTERIKLFSSRASKANEDIQVFHSDFAVTIPDESETEADETKLFHRFLAYFKKQTSTEFTNELKPELKPEEETDMTKEEFEALQAKVEALSNNTDEILSKLNALSEPDEAPEDTGDEPEPTEWSVNESEFKALVETVAKLTETVNKATGTQSFTPTPESDGAPSYGGAV